MRTSKVLPSGVAGENEPRLAMSLLCPCAAATSLLSDFSAWQPAFARSAFTMLSTSSVCEADAVCAEVGVLLLVDGFVVVVVGLAVVDFGAPVVRGASGAPPCPGPGSALRLGP